MSSAEPVPRPVAWQLHAGDAARFAAEGRHCDIRRCREPVSVVTWRWFRSARAGRVLVIEHLVCVRHGQEFAGRYRIEAGLSPAEPGRRGGTHGTEGAR